MAIINKRQNFSWLFLFFLPVLVWVLWPYKNVIQAKPGKFYILHFEIRNLIVFFCCFYGLYIVPGLSIFYGIARNWSYNSFFTPLRFLLAFSLGMVAHTFAIFIQKYLHLSYSPWVVLACLAISYLVLSYLLRPLKSLLLEEPPDRSWDFITWPVLLMALVLGIEMVLRARTSSVSLMGDAYGHLILLLGTLSEGPLPNGIPFYSTFILNLYPLSFHAILADLFTLIPHLEYIDLFRYFSLLMVPCFVLIFFSFFTLLSQSRPLAAMATLALLSVSGGGLTLQVPIVYFPWYWSLAWCLTASIFYLILKDGLSSKAISFWAGIVLGAGVLMHPMMAPRMGTILLFFFPLELLRRILSKESVGILFSRGLWFLLGLFIVLGIWVIPMLVQFGWEETYSYDYLVQNFEKIAPDAIHYIRSLKELKFGLKDLYPWMRDNAGVFPLILSPLGIIAAIKKYKNPISPLLLGWIFAMASAVLLNYLPNPYRYFEYLFLGMVAISTFGMGWLLSLASAGQRSILIFCFLAITLLGVHHDYWPKYRWALHYYGRTDWPGNIFQSSQQIVQNYEISKRTGRLDENFGDFRGFLWPRQKKVWDVYIKCLEEKNKIKSQ